VSNGKLYNRWLIVLGAILVQLCLGAIYAWSVFRKPIEQCFSCTSTQASLPFSFVLVFFALGTILGGRLQDRYGPKIVAIIGGVLLGVGMILASFATTSLTMMVIAYGVISGIGIGFAYSCPIAAGVKWFPDKRGLITGLAVAGFGAGSFFFAPLASGLIAGTPYSLLGANLFALPAVGVFNTFRILGIAYIVVVVIGALFLRNPPAGYCPAGWTPPQAKAGTPSCAPAAFTPGQMLSTGQFWIIWLLYFAGAGTGLMIIGQTSPIAQEMAKLSVKTATVAVGILAIFNALGRILWGRVSDAIGRIRTLFIIYLVNGLAVLGYFLIPTAPWYLWIGIALVGGTFGGYLAIYPAINADFFGTKNAGVNYGFIFMAYGVGGLLSNILAPKVKELTGNYNLAFVLAGALCLIACVVVNFVKAPAAKAVSS
jgi:OFA family oxalate/formate antiporter-like MFS transporter